MTSHGHWMGGNEFVERRWNSEWLWPWAWLSVLAVTMFVLSVTVCKLITYKLSNIIDSNIWPWNGGQGRCRFELKLACKHTLSTCSVHKVALLGAAICSQYIIVHLVTDERMDARTYCPQDNTVQCRWNSVKNNTSDEKNLKKWMIKFTQIWTKEEYLNSCCWMKERNLSTKLNYRTESASWY